TLDDAVERALYTKRIGLNPEQVQDFYPTPGTASTVMYYTGLDPFSMKEIYTPTDYREKQLQRALLQYRKPQMHSMVREALRKCGREDLIGNGKDCLVRPAGQVHTNAPRGANQDKRGGKPSPSRGNTKKPGSNEGRKNRHR
ncbi:MAG: DUF3362 domain-containing protein, partial [Clostridia bacterium]|nr:DUF3362 domain-containing protein [Clostridia bacterium]